MKESNWTKLKLARSSDRKRSSDYINEIFNSFIEFHGDRKYGDDNSIIAGIGMIEGRAVTIIAQEKGKNTKEQIYRNFGMTNPEGYRKALRIMKQAEKFRRPIITFIDTPGAYPGIEAEERGQGQAIAENIMEISKIKVPIISIIIGEGSSGGALGIGLGDRTIMLENSILTVASPETVSSIIYKNSKETEKVANEMKISSYELKDINIVDEVVQENSNTMQLLKKYIVEYLNDLQMLEETELLDLRYQKYRKF